MAEACGTIRPGCPLVQMARLFKGSRVPPYLRAEWMAAYERAARRPHASVVEHNGTGGE